MKLTLLATSLLNSLIIITNFMQQPVPSQTRFLTESKQKSSESQQEASWLSKIVEVETNRYKHLGGWIITHLAFFYMVLYYIPDYLRGGAWENFLDNHSTQFIMVVVPTVLHVTIKVLFNFGMYLIYTAKMPFYEKYRINPNQDWPWESNP